MTYQELPKLFRKIKYSILAVLLMAMISYASSEPNYNNWGFSIFIALIMGGVVIFLSYMAGKLFESQQLIVSSKMEAMQWIITAILAVSLVILMVPIDDITYSVAQTAGETVTGTDPGTLKTQQAAVNTIDDVNSNLVMLTDSMETRIQQLAEQASYTGVCNFWGVGFSISFCSGLNGLQNGLMPAYQMLNITIAELKLFQILVQEGGIIGLYVLLPLGFLLRSFSFTRQAGGMAIAVGLALAIILPLSILFMNSVIEDFFSSTGVSNTYDTYEMPYFYDSDGKSCDKMSTNWAVDIKPAVDRYTDENTMLQLGYPIILYGLFLTVGSLFIMVTFITSMGAMFGMPVDVSGLMRLSS